MIELNIVYSLEKEVERVKYTLAKSMWYIENGYTFSVPEGLSESSSHDEIVQAVKKDYSDEDYEHFAGPLKECWNRYVPKIEQLSSLKGFAPLPHLCTIVLTKYGTGGSYFPNEGKVIISCRKGRKRNPVGTTMHELVHMGVEHLVETYKISHWRKERFVDLICNKYFADVETFQEIPEDVSIVDKSFHKSYPNLEKIAKEIGI